MMRTSKPLSPRSLTISPAAPCAVLDEGLDLAAPAEHEGVSDMNQRGKIDVGYPAGDQFDKPLVDAAILGLLGINQRSVIMNKPAAARGQRQAPGIGVDADVPGLRPGLAPIELRQNRQTSAIGKGKIGRDGRGAIAGEG